MISLVLQLISLAVTVYTWIIIISVVLSWLTNLNIINGYRPEVRALQRFCYRATEPLLAPIRRRLPDFGGLDISPIVLLLGMQVLQILVFKVATELLA